MYVRQLLFTIQCVFVLAEHGVAPTKLTHKELKAQESRTQALPSNSFRYDDDVDEDEDEDEDDDEDDDGDDDDDDDDNNDDNEATAPTAPPEPIGDEAFVDQLTTTTAIVTTTERAFVIRINNGKAAYVNVKRGGASGELVEVQGALVEGDVIVKRGTDELREGTPLRGK